MANELSIYDYLLIEFLVIFEALSNDEIQEI